MKHWIATASTHDAIATENRSDTAEKIRKEAIFARAFKGVARIELSGRPEVAGPMTDCAKSGNCSRAWNGLLFKACLGVIGRYQTPDEVVALLPRLRRDIADRRRGSEARIGREKHAAVAAERRIGMARDTGGLIHRHIGGDALDHAIAIEERLLPLRRLRRDEIDLRALQAVIVPHLGETGAGELGGQGRRLGAIRILRVGDLVLRWRSWRAKGLCHESS